MKAIDFVRAFNKERQNCFIAGGYALHLALNTEFTDIDIYTPLMKEILDVDKQGNIGIKDTLNYVFENDQGMSFRKVTKSYPDSESRLVVYESQDHEDYKVNLMFVRGLNSIDLILDSFDMSILRIAATSEHDFTVADKLTESFQKSLDQKLVRIGRKRRIFTGKDQPDRISKYQQRLPGFEFIEVK